MEVGVHAGLEDGNAAEVREFGGVGLVVEGAGDEDVESALGGLTGGLDEVGTGDGAELGADENRGTLLSDQWLVVSGQGWGGGLVTGHWRLATGKSPFGAD